MKKIKKIILTLLVMSFLANPMCLILRVHAANEEIALSRISDTLQSVMQSSEEETIEVMIWLEDINTSQAVLSSTESILSAAKATLSPRALCENPETDAEIYSRYMDARKEIMRECYEEYTKEFAEAYLCKSEIIYLSRYTPTIIGDLSRSRIIELSTLPIVVSVDFYYEKAEEIDNSYRLMGSNSKSGVSDYYYTPTQIKNLLSFASLYNLADSQGEGAVIGVYDNGYPELSNSIFNGVSITHHYTPTENYTNFRTHPTEVMEILCTIVPEATFLYSTYYATAQETFVPNRPVLSSEFEWFIDNDVHLISTSQSLSTATSHEYQDDNLDYGSVAAYLDYVSYYYCITIIQSAGNVGKDRLCSGALAYNIITVGNYNWGEFEIASDSSYYTGSIFAHKPDLCAPGNIAFSTTGSSYSATSYSTPVAASMAAMIISYYVAEQEVFRCMPSNIKAIMCLGTEREQYNINNNNYHLYGAGVINCAVVAWILNNNSYVLDSIPSTTYSKEYTIYIDENSDAHIGLVFEKCCEHTYDTDERCGIANLNIELYGTSEIPIGISSTTHSNVEIIRLPQGLSGDYTLRIVQVTSAICENNEIETYYTLVWNCE